jgi:hypothetical protein
MFINKNSHKISLKVRTVMKMLMLVSRVITLCGLVGTHVLGEYSASMYSAEVSPEDGLDMKDTD